MTLNPFAIFMGNRTSFIDIGFQATLQTLTALMTQASPDARELHGPPGIGKTALMRYLAGPDFVAQWQEHMYRGETTYTLIPVYVSYQGWTEQDRDPLTAVYTRFYEAVAKHAPGVLDDTTSDTRPPPADTNILLDQIDRDIRQLVRKGYRPVFLLDDYHRVYNLPHAAHTHRLFLRSDGAMVLVATEQRLERITRPPWRPSSRSPLEVKLIARDLSPLNEADALAFLEAVTAEASKHDDGQATTSAARSTVPADEFRELYALAGGFRELLLLAAQAWWDLIQNDGTLPDDWARRLGDRLQVEYERYFLSFREMLVNAELWDYLQRWAGSGQFPDRSGDSYNPQRSALTQLIAYGFLKQEEERIAFFSPLFEAFVRADVNDSTAVQESAAVQESVPARLPQAQPAHLQTAPTEVRLTGLEDNLYSYLRRHPDQVISFADLSRGVWGTEPTDDLVKTMRVTISKVRQKLRPGEDIISVRSQGYRFATGR